MAPAIETLYATYKDKVEFFLVYVREAHPVQEREGGRPGRSGGVDISQPKTADERALVASDCLKALKLSLPVLVDDMKGTVEKAYGGWPAATVVIDLGGHIAFYSRGPDGARPKEAEKVLKDLLAQGQKPAAADPPAEKPPGPETPKAADPGGDGIPAGKPAD